MMRSGICVLLASTLAVSCGDATTAPSPARPIEQPTSPPTDPPGPNDAGSLALAVDGVTFPYTQLVVSHQDGEYPVVAVAVRNGPESFDLFFPPGAGAHAVAAATGGPGAALRAPSGSGHAEFYARQGTITVTGWTAQTATGNFDVTVATAGGSATRRATGAFSVRFDCSASVPTMTVCAKQAD